MHKSLLAIAICADLPNVRRSRTAVLRVQCTRVTANRTGGGDDVVCPSIVNLLRIGDCKPLPRTLFRQAHGHDGVIPASDVDGVDLPPRTCARLGGEVEDVPTIAIAGGLNPHGSLRTAY